MRYHSVIRVILGGLLFLALSANAATNTSADCFFNWMETTYPQYFAPAQAPSQTIDVYYYRHYSATNAYLALANTTRHMLYVGPLSGGAVVDFGDISPLLGVAGCPQPTISHASGTYTWDSTTGVLAGNTTSSDFSCNGPSTTWTNTGVIVTATTMTWPNDSMTWTRSSGTAGDILGTWIGYDSTTGNSYTFTVNADLTFSVTGMIVACGGDGGSNPRAYSQHWSSGYNVNLSYADPNKTATSVSVTGPGISGALSLVYSTSYGQGAWVSWTLPGYPVQFGTTYPPLPYTYTFSITDATGTRAATAAVSCFQERLATNLSPSGMVSATPMFSWIGIGDADAIYGVELEDSNYNRIWMNDNMSGTSIAYSGPALISGATYYYFVQVRSSSTCDQASFAQGGFTYGSNVGVSQFDGTYTGSWSVTCPACNDTAAGTFTTTLANGVFTNTIVTITSGTHGPGFDSGRTGTVSSSGAITATGASPSQCSSSVSTFTGQITITSSGGAEMTMNYSRPASPEGCEAEYGTITATRG